MSAIRAVLLVLPSLFLSGCGLRVPEIQDFGDSTDGELFVEQIVSNVNCEITEAVKYVVAQDKKLAAANGGVRQAKWFDGWGVQTTLSLTLDEKGGVNPTVNWLPPSPVTSVFNLGATATLSSDANRVDKLNSYNTVKQFLAAKECKRPGGPFLLQSDLGLREWLVDVILGVNTGVITFPTAASFNNNVISHELKFDITSSAGLVPGWKLTKVSINQTGAGLTLSRERTHDLTITLGPTAATPVGQKPATDANGHLVLKNGKPIMETVYASGPSGMASDAHLASQIGSSVASAVKAALQP
jgi:hypothetical protein